MNTISNNNFKHTSIINGLKGQQPQIKEENSGDFSKFIENNITKLNDVQQQAEQSVQNFAIGKEDVAKVVLSLNKADIHLRMAVEVRNKAVDAYKEIMRISI